MLRDEARQPAIYRPGPYWLPYQRRVAKAIRRLGLRDFRAHGAIGKGYADTLTIRADDVWIGQGPLRHGLKAALARMPILRGMLADYERIVDTAVASAQRHRDGYYMGRFGDWLREQNRRTPLPVTTHGGTIELVHLDGVDVARLYIDVLLRLHNFSQHVALDRVRSVLEIGGGFGAWVHLLLNRHSNVRKVAYVDIPPMIYVGTQYLQHFYGAAVRDYRQTSGPERIRFSDNDSLEILCLCPWQIERLEAKVDLFWNTGSFAEMTPEIVRNYARHIGRLLVPAGTACLLINKAAQPDRRTTTPEDIFAAFAGAMAFETFAPALEHEGHGLYAVGRTTRPA